MLRLLRCMLPGDSVYSPNVSTATASTNLPAESRQLAGSSMMGNAPFQAVVPPRPVKSWRGTDWHLQAAVLCFTLLGLTCIIMFAPSDSGPIAELAVLGVTCTLPILISGVKLYSTFQVTLGLLFMFYVLSPLVDLDSATGSLATRALLYVLGFVIALMVGYYVPLGRMLASRMPKFAPGWTSRRLRIAIPLLLILGIAGFVLFLQILGSSIVGLYVYSQKMRTAVVEVGGLYFFRNLFLWCLWCVIWISAISLLTRRKPVSRIKLLAGAGLFVPMVLIVMPLGQRAYLLLPFLSSLALLEMNGKRIRMVWPALAVPVFLVLSRVYTSYRTLSNFRRATLSSVLDSVQGMGWLELTRQGILATTERLPEFMAVLAKWDVGGEPFLHGRTYYHLPWLLVPRSLLPIKPLYTDEFLTRLVSGVWWQGLAFGSVSELFINFGLLGILAGGLVYGVVLKTADTYVESNIANPSIQLLFVTGGIFLPLLVTGGLYSVTMIEAVFYSLLSAALALLLSSKRVPS